MSDPPWAGIIDTQRVKKRFYPGFLNIDRAPVSNLVPSLFFAMLFVCFARPLLGQQTKSSGPTNVKKSIVLARA